MSDRSASDSRLGFGLRDAGKAGTSRAGRQQLPANKAATLSANDAQELATAATVSPATKVALATAPTNGRVLQAAVAEIVVKLRIPPAQALARLQALGKVPLADLTFLQANGPKVQQAAAQLKSLAAVPAADLAYLQANAAKVAKVGKAKLDNPGQWQTWWWICFVGQLVFIPLVFLLTGHWSPRKAREDELSTRKMVQRELERLHAGPGGRGEVAPSTS